ncbi:MAG: CarD family transcriptional regulator [Polyangiaceae bacterium]
MASPSRSTPTKTPKAPASQTRVAAAPKRAPGLSPGARCVHPQHGVVEIVGVVTRELGGASVALYELKLVAGEGKILVPVAAAESAGLRPIMTAKEADELLAFMKTRRDGHDARPFQKRMRAYGEMLRSGDRRAIAEVLRDMHRSSTEKDLSFGERRLLAQARAMLVTELAMAKRTTVDAIEAALEAAFAA